MELKASNPILVVEDNEDDYEVLQRSFKKAGFERPVVHVVNGEKALDYLYNEIDASIRPGLVLLDINMPGIGGLEVLQKIKTNAKLKSIPVVMLTTSDSSLDINKCYKLGANGYIAKPVDFEKFIEAMKSVKSFFFEAASLPNSDDG
ncbi:two-component system response regulator [Candidatus Kaiserbacteria bacterium]|nr:MAG: two-component system response regulator [Candidatus Kaiserbacteria bacterium]